MSKKIKYLPAVIALIIVAILFLFYLNKLISKEKYLYISPNDKSIQTAVDLALKSPNIPYTIKILPGVYREPVTIKDASHRQAALKIQALNSDKEKVILRGSKPSTDYKWNLCDEKSCKQFSASVRKRIYYASLDWDEIPYFLVGKTSDGVEKQLFMAREPDYSVTTKWKYHENWWTAKDSQKSQFSLVDGKNLPSLSKLEGSNVFMMDGADRCGTFLYQKTVDKFDKTNGEILFSQPVGFSIFGSQETGIGPDTKYFIEGDKQFLNSAGEWIYDKKDKKLYVLSPDDVNPANLFLEIARRNYGINIENAKNIEIDGITFENYNYFPDTLNGAIIIDPSEKQSVQDIALKNLVIKNSGNGIVISSHKEYRNVNNISILNTKIHDNLNNAVFAINTENLRIENSEIFDVGHYFNVNAVNIIRSNNVHFINNKVHDTGYNGVQISGYERSDNTVENIIIENNTIYNSCQSASFCAALKLYGGKYNNTIVKKNILKDNKGWSYCQEKQGSGSIAYGMFISNASGINVSSNISLNNSKSAYLVYPRQIAAYSNIFLNNLAGYSDTGIELANGENSLDADENAISTRHDNTVIKNNVFVENKIGLAIDSIHPDKITVDYNAYINNINNASIRALSSVNWDEHSFITDKKALKNADKDDFNLSFFSPLRGRGEPLIDNPFLNFQLDFLGLSNDIGPCKFQWIGNSCPAIN